MAYTRTYTLVATPGGDTVKQAVATKLDGDLTNIFTYLNTHEALTATHGATGAIFGTTGAQSVVGTQTWRATAIETTYGGTGIDSHSSTGVPKVSAGTWSIQALTNGQLLIGSTGAVPAAAALTQGTGITITNGAGSISVANAFTAGAIEYVIDNGGAEITDGVWGGLKIPFACTLTAWYLGADQSGSIKIDVWKKATYPPTNGETITNGHEPEISSATNASDTDLADWSDVTIDAGDWLFFNVDSCTTITRCTICLYITRTA